MIPFEQDNLKAYTLLLRIEIVLRESLRISLESEYGVYWRKRLPGELLKKVKESQTEENRPQFNFVRLGPLYYLTFGELLTLLQQKSGRTVAKELGGECFLKQLENIFAPRNALCHLRPVSSVGLKAIEALYAVVALQTIRDGKAPPDFDEGMSEMIVSALIAQDDKLTHAADVTVQIDSPAGKQTLQSRFIEKAGVQLRKEQVQEWIEDHRALLAGNGISIVLIAIDRWELPSAYELHRLGRISGFRIPKDFGPSLGEQAVTKFKAGDIAGCVEEFSRMLADKDDAQVRNNLAFCQLLMGQETSAVENATKATTMDYEPLYELNKGIGEFLQGNISVAKQSLKNALAQLRRPDNKHDREDAIFVLVLQSEATKVGFHEALPIDAAILINLWRMGDLTRADLEAELIRIYSERARPWLAAFAAPRAV